ncbi:MAG: PKD domain-containing protein, partial [Brumimicrobium sp.]
MKFLNLLLVACFTLISSSIIIAQTCNADATISQTGNPGEVEIIDNSTTSSGSSATYSWVAFYDSPGWNYIGDVSLQPNSITGTFQFSQNGTYNYIINVQDSLTNCTDSISGSITITNFSLNCDANFTHIDTINNQTAFSPDNYDSNLDYYWDFGDGNSSTDPYPWHTYANPGTYTACLTVWDSANNGNCADTVCQTVVVDSNNCNVSADFSYIDLGNGTYDFTVNNINNNAFYEWSIGTDNYSASNVTHTFPSNGQFNATLFAMDSTNSTCVDTVSYTIHVTSADTCSIVANFTHIDTINNQTAFSPDNYDSNLDYFWDFGDGNWSTDPYPWHTYANPGTYTACLTVWDSANNGNCADTICQTIIVDSNNCNYSADFTYQDTLNNETAFFPDTYDPNLNYGWDFGDGNWSTDINPYHTYANPGNYTVCLTISESGSNGYCTDTVCQTIVVNSLSNCNADLTVNLTGNPGEVEIIDNSTTSSGSNATYSWVEIYQNSPWNHEATINLQPNSNTATYQFTDNGTYTYYYTVQDSITNCFDTLMGSITINNVPS